MYVQNDENACRSESGKGQNAKTMKKKHKKFRSNQPKMQSDRISLLTE